MFVETDFNSFYCGLLVKIKYNIKNESGGGGKELFCKLKKIIQSAKARYRSKP